MSIIPDNELVLSGEEDFFKTRAYSDAIFNLIEENDGKERLTIGLFGGWGTGKSSIIKTLKHRLKDSKQTATILYDAWKYSGDEFRRSFLLELKKQLELAPEQTFNEFYTDKSEEVDHKVRLQKLPLALTVPIALFGIAVAVLGTVSAIKSPQQASLTGEWVAIIAGLGFTAVALVLQFMFQNLLIVYRVSRTTPRLFSAEQFEAVFREAMQAVTEGEKPSVWRWFKGPRDGQSYRKVVIIVDNIDRCHKELARELLLTIKNFLELPNCVFVIPVDDEAIRSHLEFGGREGAEFLRKFFTTTVRIRKYSPTDLFGFTNNLVEKHGLGFGPRIADIIAQEFADNPRRIIQFLNNLSLEVKVAREQEAMKTIEAGSVTGNVEFLAKLLVIREEWCDLYSRISRESYLLSEIEGLLRREAFKKDDTGVYTTKEPSGISLSEAQYNFLRRTMAVGVANTVPFLRLRDFDRDIPEALLEHLKNGNWEGIKALLQSSKVTLTKVSEKLKSNLDEATNRQLVDRETTLLNLFFAMAGDKDFGPQCKTLCDDMGTHLDRERIILLMPYLNAEAVVSYSKNLCERGKPYLRDHIVTALEQAGQKDPALLKAFVLGYKSDPESLKKVRPVFTKRMQEDEAFIQDNQYRELLENEEIAKHLIDRSVADTLTTGITNNHADAKNTQRLRILKTLVKGNVMTAKQFTAYVVKLHPFVNTNDWEPLLFWLQAMEGFVERCEKVESTPLMAVLQNRQNFLQGNVVSPNRLEELYLKCLFSFQNLLCEYLLANKGADLQPMEWLMLHFRSNVPQVCLHTGEVFRRIVAGLGKPMQWPFIQPVIERFSSATDLGLKDGLASTLILMIQKTENANGKVVGMQKAQIEAVVKNCVSYLSSAGDDGGKRAVGWLGGISENSLAQSIVEETLVGISDQGKLRKILPLVWAGISPKARGLMAQTLVRSNTEYEELSLNVKTALSLADAQTHVRDGLIQLLGQNEDVEETKAVIRVCVDRQELFDNDAMGRMIDDKFVPILAGRSIPDAITVCRELLRLKFIPLPNHNTLKALLVRIHVPEGEEKERDEAVLAELRKQVGG